MKRRTLALILAAALTVTSVEGTAVMASAAEFTSEAAVEENIGQESETDVFSSDFAEETEMETLADPEVESGSEPEIFSDQENEITSEEVGITDGETQEEEAADDEISILDEADDGEDEEKIEITDGEESEVTDNEESAFTDGESDEADIEVFAGEDEAAPTLTGIEVLKPEISLYEEFQSYNEYKIEDILTLNYGTESKPGMVCLGNTYITDKAWNDVNGITAKLVYADSDKPVVWSEKNNTRYLQPGSYKYIFTWTPEDETQKPVSVETRINVIAFADVFEQLPKLKEGRQKVVFNGELFFSFVPEVRGTYQFNANRDFPCTIQELEEDGKLSIDYTSGYGDSISAELEGGKQYVVCIYGENGLRGESLTIDRVPVVESVEIASWSPENLTFTEGNAVSFHSINVRLKTNKGSEIVRLYGHNGLYGNMTDAYGNTVGYALYKIENNKFVKLTNMNSLSAGEYAFRVYYNNGNMTPGKKPDFIAENYVPVHIKSVQEQTKDSALDTEKDLTVKVENSRAIYSFTPKKTGRYELSTSTFVNGVLRDGAGKEIAEQSSSERSMYVSLAKDTTYYMYMTVQSSLCTQVQVSAKKLALPVKITVSLKKTSYTAELTKLWEVQPKFTVKYEDGTSETATEDSVVSGWGLEYYLGNSQGDAIYDRAACIPAGTWICAPKLKTDKQDEEILKDVLTVQTYGQEIKAESQEINISTLEEIKVDTPVTVPETKQTFYKVVADAGQSYKLEMPDGVTAKFYKWDEGLKNINGYSVYFETGTTYLIGVTAYRESEITLRKISGGVSGPQYFKETYPLVDGFRQTIQMPEDKASPATLEFTFKPDEDASYCFQIESNLKTRVLLYEGEGDQKEDIYGKNSDGDLKVSYYLNEGKTYTYQMVCNDMKSFDKVTVSFNKAGEYKPIKEMTYSLKDGMKATDLNILTDFFDVYDVQIHYTDDSVLMLEYNWNGYAETDDYGNFLMCEWDTNIENAEAAETVCDISIEYRNAKDEKWTQKTVTVPMSGLAGMQSLKTGDSVYPFRNQGTYSAYRFTAEESGLYLWRAKTEEGEPSPQFQVYSYELNSHGARPVFISPMRMNELEDNGYTVWLEKGESYLIGTGRDGVEYNGNVTLSVKRAKILQSVEIKKNPNQTTLYPVESFSGVSLEGMVITAHYTDGTSEDILYGQTDSNGTLFEMDTYSDNGHWISGKKFRQELHFGDYSFYVDFDAAEIPKDVPVVKVNIKTNTYVEGKEVVPVRFRPEETGFYSVEVPNEGTSAAVDEETGERWIGTDYYFEKDRSYLIYVWAYQKDAYVTIRRGVCQWQMVTKTEPTCTEDAQYVMKCKIHDHTYSYSSHYEEKDKACGHAYRTWKVTKKATCTEAGEEERTCARCNNTERRTIAATGHSYGKWKVTKKVTCTEAGEEKRTCVNCDKTEKRTIAAIGKHNYGSWKTTKGPTVFNTGQKERICRVCKKKEKKSIAKLKATISLNVSGTIPLKTRQTFTARVTMGKGDRVVSWKSSNTRVVSVDKNGKVKGLRAGKTATITVQLRSGLKKSFKVNVQNANVATRSLQVTNASTRKRVSSRVSLKRRQTLKLAVTLSPITSRERVEYFSSDKRIVSVSSRGVIRANRTGRAIITVKSGRKIYRIRITVK